MITYIINGFCTAIELAAIIVAGCSLLSVPLSRAMKRFAVCVPIILGVCCLAVLSDDINFQNLSINIIIFVIFLLTLQPVLGEMAFVYCLCYIFVFIAEIPIIIIFNIFNFPLPAMGLHFIGALFPLINIYIFCRFFPLSPLYTYITRHNRVLYGVLVNSFLILYIICLYYKLMPSTFLDRLLFFVALISVLILVNIQSFITQRHINTQQRQLDAYHKYMPIIENLINDIRMRQHNYANDIQALRSLALLHEGEDNALAEDLLKYTIQMSEDFPHAELLRCNLHLVSGFLISKCTEASERGIHLFVDLKADTFNVDIPEYQIINILGILIDNAMEASVASDNIYVAIDYIENETSSMRICVKNPGPHITPELSYHMFSTGYSTKADVSSEHNIRGFGLSSLKSIVDSYNGDITLENEMINNQEYLCFDVSFISAKAGRTINGGA